jgi:hypothetical protein
MADVLIYQTSDPEFADRAVEALREAGIDCHRRGQGVRRLNATTGNWTDKQVYIYVHREEDSRRANEILTHLGAVVDTPRRSPNRWLLFILATGLTVIALLVARG